MNRKERRLAALKAAQAIVDGVKAAGRQTLTQAERQEVEAKLAEADRWQKEIEREEADAKIFEKLGEMEDAAIAHREGFGIGVSPGSADDAITAMKSALVTKSAVQVSLPRKVFTGSPAGSGQSIQDGAVREAPIGSAAISLSRLFPTVQVSTPTIRTYTVGQMSGVDIVAEGAVKPEITGPITPQDSALVKLAGRIKTTMEFSTDAAALLKRIMHQAGLDLIRRENTLLLDTMAATSGVSVKTGAASAVLDLILEASANLVTINGSEPSFLVMSPTDVAAMYKLKSTGSGEYLVDPFTATNAKGPFGLQVVPVPGMTPGTLWLGSGEAGRWYQHTEGVQVRLGTSGDDFDRNITTTIIEERVLPVIEQPSFLTKITLTA